jgi:hypothetical protein
LQINERISEIGRTIDLCTDRDDDVLDNLERELETLIEVLECSLRLAQVHESGLKVVI